MVNTLESLRISQRLKEEQQQVQAQGQGQPQSQPQQGGADGTLTGNKEDDARALDAISSALIDKLTSDEKFSEAVGKAITPLLERFGEELVSKLKGEGNGSTKQNNTDQQQQQPPQQQQSQGQDQQQQ